jgi:hypothetical protein
MGVQACVDPCCPALVGAPGLRPRTRGFACFARDSTSGFVGTEPKEESHVTCLIKLVDSILEGDLVPLLGVCPDSRAALVDVRREDNFRPVNHEERREAGGSTRRGAQAPKGGL